MCGQLKSDCDCPVDKKIHEMIHEITGLPHAEITADVISRRLENAV